MPLVLVLNRETNDFLIKYYDGRLLKKYILLIYMKYFNKYEC